MKFKFKGKCEDCKYNEQDNIALFGCNPCNHCGEEGSDITHFEPKEEQKMDKWHSIKEEGYPKVEKEYLVTRLGHQNSRYIDVISFVKDLSKYEGFDEDPVYIKKPGFIEYDSEWGEYFERDVVAWMECPAKYMGE